MKAELFKEALKQAGNLSKTENQALGHMTTYNAFVDFNFRIPFYREYGNVLLYDFDKMLNDDPHYAMKMLFYLRDIRGGIGERQSFRNIIREYAHLLSITHVALIPEYGRYDDLFSLFGTVAEPLAVQVIQRQFILDRERMEQGKPVSLLAKWLPSIGSRNRKQRSFARQLCHKIGVSQDLYKAKVKELRAHLDVVEVKMSQNKWGKINYEIVPSKANALYANAFMRHDSKRRDEFLVDALIGKKKMNASAIFPHDIVYGMRTSQDTRAYDAQWKNLPDYMAGAGNTIVVLDTSGSMSVRVGKSGVRAFDVASALAIYCSERLEGVYKDQVISFSSFARYFDLSDLDSLYQKYTFLARTSIIDNTDIESVFDLILDTAVENNVDPSEMIDNVLIISDMEFDYAREVIDTHHETLMQTIERKYDDAGVKMPNLVFWNVNGRTNTIPTMKGTTKLISGFSPAVLQQVLGLNETAWEGLRRILDSERYELVAPPLMENKEQ